jgi:outer membrane protein assembly factor BamB
VYERRVRFKSRGQVVSSLSAAGDYLYVTNIEGTTKVLRLGRKFEEVAENTLEPLRSSLVFADGRLYVRTMDHLWCVGKKS